MKYVCLNIYLINYCFSFQFLLSKRPEQVNLGGERGRTPLHYAALIDNVDAAKILVCINKHIKGLYLIAQYFLVNVQYNLLLSKQFKFAQ